MVVTKVSNMVDRNLLIGEVDTFTFLRLCQKVTRASLEVPLFPWVCPVCGRELPPKGKVTSLVLHHWNSGCPLKESSKFLSKSLKDFSKVEDILDSRYRRLCPSCNHIFGIALSRKLLKSGQISWLEQISRVNAFLLQSRDYTLLPKELPWSKFLPIEERLLEELLTDWSVSDLRYLSFYNDSIPLLVSMLRRLN